MMRARVLLLLLAACTAAPERRDVPYDGAPWTSPRPEHPIDKAVVAVVTNSGSDTISLLDLGSNAVVATMAVDLDPIDNDGPHHAVIDPAGEFLYSPFAYPVPTLALGPHSGHGESNTPGVLVKLRMRDLGRVAALTVSDNPGDVAMTPDGAIVIVSHFDLKRATQGMAKGAALEALRAPLSIVSADKLKLLAEPSPCIAAHGMAMSKDGKTLYLACYGEDAIGKIGLSNPAVPTVELLPLGPTLVRPPISLGPYFVTLSDDGALLVVSESDGKALRRFDLSTNKTTARLPLPGSVFGPAMTEDGAAWLVPVQQPDSVVRVSTATFTDEKTRPLTKAEGCERPHQIARRAGRYFLVCEGDHVGNGSILELDPVTLATIRTFNVGAYPDVIAFPMGSK